MLLNLEKVPGHLWQDKKNQKEFMESLGNQLRFLNLDDWYDVTKQDIRYYSELHRKLTQSRENGGAGLLSLFNDSLLNLMTSIYPGRNQRILNDDRA